MRLLSAIFLIVTSLCLHAQFEQEEYLEAKRQFSLGNYKVAMQAFKPLTTNETFGAYASFYYALAAFKADKPQVASDMWKQVAVKYPDWNKRSEVDFWLAYTFFHQNKLYQAFKQSESLPQEVQASLIHSFLGKMTLDELATAATLNPDNESIAKYYIEALQKQPYSEQNQDKISELADKFSIDIQGEELPLVEKDAYAIAVVLPFMFESVDNPQTVIRNSIILDLYQGMELARKQLDKIVKLNFFPFDTQKKGSVAAKLVSEGKLDHADVIVGPLYSGPSKYLQNFSREQQKTLVNPLSSNAEVIKNNPYGYLFKSTYATQGRQAAKFAAQKFTDNKKLFIFYETDRDSLIANAYKKELEKEGFFVIRYDRLTSDDAQQIQKDFTEEYEVRLDNQYSQREIDSITLIPGRIVRTRSLRNERTGRIVRDEDGEEVTEYYEVRFTVQPDSIGHIFAATSSNLLANNLISMVEVRTDSIGIIGYENWLDFSLVSYDQLERLQINFINPSLRADSELFNQFKQQVISEVGKEPSEYHIYGYELIMQMGHLMAKHGKYFQRGLKDGIFYPGFVMEGIKYGTHKDNQVVPITTLKGLRLENEQINSPE